MILLKILKIVLRKEKELTTMVFVGVENVTQVPGGWVRRARSRDQHGA